MNSSATSPPGLSVILVTPDCYATIRQTIRALARQTVRDRLEIVIVAPSKRTLGAVDKELEAFHSVGVIEFGEMKALAAPRVAGIHAATAPFVALCEDHAFPEPNWAEALIGAYHQSPAAVGPVFLNGNPGVTSWISLIMDYGRWMEPVPGGFTDDVAGHSSSWNRSLLLEYGPALERMMQAPTLMHWDLQTKGHRLYLEPAAKVRHVNISRFIPHVLDHFYSAWIFAAARGRDWNWLRRLAYVGGNVLLMPRTLRGWLGHIRRAGLETELLPKAWPLLILSLFVWTLGEMFGYGFGMRRAEERVLGFDARREAYLNRRDRELLIAR